MLRVVVFLFVFVCLCGEISKLEHDVECALHLSDNINNVEGCRFPFCVCVCGEISKLEHNATYFNVCVGRSANLNLMQFI